MGKGRTENLLRPKRDLTTEQRRKNASKAGKASVKKKRERKALQEITRIVLDMPLEAGDLADIEGITFEDYPDVNLTLGQKAVLAAAKRAMSGDVAALQFLRDTAGEKPVERVEVSGDVAEAAKSIQEMIASSKKRLNVQ